MKKLVITFFAAVCLFLTAIPVFAQQPFPISPKATPISGMAVLAALGGGYALKKLYERKREK